MRDYTVLFGDSGYWNGRDFVRHLAGAKKYRLGDEEAAFHESDAILVARGVITWPIMLSEPDAARVLLRGDTRVDQSLSAA